MITRVTCGGDKSHDRMGRRYYALIVPVRNWGETGAGDGFGAEINEYLRYFVTA
ncbi:MAG: hypothetical protein FJ042_01180 [Candidatus Cloacimonetes bacterium]|nr:hypothetical protein [Candidatus Cloacimonadota bacterium]